MLATSCLLYFSALCSNGKQTLACRKRRVEMVAQVSSSPWIMTWWIQCFHISPCPPLLNMSYASSKTMFLQIFSGCLSHAPTSHSFHNPDIQSGQVRTWRCVKKNYSGNFHRSASINIGQLILCCQFYWWMFIMIENVLNWSWNIETHLPYKFLGKESF